MSKHERSSLLLEIDGCTANQPMEVFCERARCENENKSKSYGDVGERSTEKDVKVIQRCSRTGCGWEKIPLIIVVLLYWLLLDRLRLNGRIRFILSKSNYFSLTGSKTFLWLGLLDYLVANNTYTGFKIVHQASRNADRRNWMRDDEQRWVNNMIVYWSSINNRLRLRTNSASNPVAQAN